MIVMIVMVDLVNLDGRRQFTKQFLFASTAYALRHWWRAGVDRMPRVIRRGPWPATDVARMSCLITIERRRLVPYPPGTPPDIRHGSDK